MFSKQKSKLTVKYLSSHVLTVFGLVLVWRGIWYVLDGIDKLFFDDSHGWTGLAGIIIGLLILYLPDKNLKEIEKI